ncbi:MAG: hypothetical protein P8J32_07405 [bacterium]|nr:hypothetical protein [bacterium]
MTINFTLNAGNNIVLNLPTSQTIKTVTSQANTINIIKATAGTVTVSDINNIGNVVVTNPTDTQLLQFNGSNWVNIAADTVGGGGTLDSAITISNADPSFAHMDTPIASGTSLEAVLRDMLEMYNRTTISLVTLVRATQLANGSYSTTSTTGSGATLEVGQGLQVTAFNITIGDNTQTTDSSVSFRRNSTVIESGFSDADGTKTLSSAETYDPGTYTSAFYEAQVIDDGGSGLPDENLDSNNITFYWRYRVKAGITTTATIADEAEAQTRFDGIDTSPGYNNLTSETPITITADATYNSSGNYVIMAFPSSWGAVSSIVLDGANSITNAFVDLGDFNITNDYGVEEEYSFYRATADGAYTNGQTIKFSF